jgi:hypothetical protein
MNDTAEKASAKAQGLAQAHKERAKGLARDARSRGSESGGSGGEGREGPPSHAKAYGQRGERPERGGSSEGRRQDSDRRQDGGRSPRDEIKERIQAMRARRRRRG